LRIDSALALSQNSHDFQDLQGLAQGCSVYPELLGQLPLGRKFGSWNDLARRNKAFDIRDEFGGYAGIGFGFSASLRRQDHESQLHYKGPPDKTGFNPQSF